jgi:hypothetical protein
MALPVEPARHKGELTLAGQKGEIADANDGVLKVRRDDREVFVVQSGEPQKLHG